LFCFEVHKEELGVIVTRMKQSIFERAWW